MSRTPKGALVLLAESIWMTSWPSDMVLTVSAKWLTASLKIGKLVGQVMASFQA